MYRSKPVRPTHILTALAALLLAATACAGGPGSEPAAELAGLADDQASVTQDSQQPPPPPPRPKTCESSQDCTDACPPGSKGCACTQTPQGAKVCAPTCSVDTDCVVPPGAPPGKCDQGFCAPPPPPPRPKTCQSASDCTDACPPGSKGCVCAQSPQGAKVCAPSCSADADCPAIPGIPPLHCHEGVCAPPPPPHAEP